MAEFSVVIKTDASPESGLGHLRRCMALAEALRPCGGRVTFWIEHPEAIGIVEQAGWRFEIVSAGALPVRGELDVLVLDGYHDDERLVSSARRDAGLVVVIEDLPGQGGAADLVINAGLTGEPSPPGGEGTSMRLSGSPYALLPLEFSETPERAYPVRIGRALLTMGGGDLRNLTPRAMEWIRRALPEACLDVVAGPLCDDTTLQQEAAGRLLAKVWRAPEPGALRQLMLKADVAVSSAGQTLFQLAACGTPTVAIALFENQLAHVRTLATSGVVAWVGRWDDPDLETRVARGIASCRGAEQRRAMGERARRLVDGAGARRAAEAIVNRLHAVRIHA